MYVDLITAEKILVGRHCVTLSQCVCVHVILFLFFAFMPVFDVHASKKKKIRAQFWTARLKTNDIYGMTKSCLCDVLFLEC